MPAYVIVEVEITDPVSYEEYRTRVNLVNKKFHGKFLVRGGKIESLEGDWHPKRIAMVEFPTMDQALEWYHSRDYAELIQLRKDSSHFKMILVEGAA